MKLALIQMESTIGGLEKNVDRASSFIDEAAGDGAQLVVLPEFWSTGYFPLAVDYSLYDLADSEDGKATTAVKEKARQHGVHIASTIYERQAAGLFYNTSMMVNPEGEVISKYRKVHVPARRGLEKLFLSGRLQVSSGPSRGVAGRHHALLRHLVTRARAASALRSRSGERPLRASGGSWALAAKKSRARRWLSGMGPDWPLVTVPDCTNSTKWSTSPPTPQPKQYQPCLSSRMWSDRWLLLLWCGQSHCSRRSPSWTMRSASISRAIRPMSISVIWR